MLNARLTLKWLRPLLGGLMLVAFMIQPALAGAPQISYDQAADLLSVQTEGVSLKLVLAKITLLSGVAFLIDPAVEQPVTITLVDRPLEKGLIRMVQTLDLGYAMVYQKKEGQAASAEPLLTSMKIVPKGMENNPNLELVPNLNMGGEALLRNQYQRQLSQRSPGDESSRLDYAEARWQARLKNMPEEQRKKLEDLLKRRQERQAARKERPKAIRAEHQAREEARRAEQQADDELLKETNPERYELRMQRREERKRKKEMGETTP